MSTIKSSAENLTLNADGANNDIKFQSNGSEVASIDQAGSLVLSGTLTSTAPLVVTSDSYSAIKLKDAAGTDHSEIYHAHGDDSLVLANYKAGDLNFKTNNITRATFLAAGGLTFNGDTAAANALDDYEEGTWTAGITGASQSGGNTVAHYTKIGRQVFFQWYSSAITISSASGTAYITGLPFATSNATEAYGVFNYQHGNALDGGTTGGYVNRNDSRMTFVDTAAISAATFIDGADKYIMVAGSYFVA